MQSSFIPSPAQYQSQSWVARILDGVTALFISASPPQPCSFTNLKPHYLEQALELKQFSLDYQPQVNVKTGSLVGVEVLSRWHHPQLGNIAPKHFIPLAESTGLIFPLGYWILEQACCQYQKWASVGIAPPTMAVNLSAHQFADPQLVEKIKAILEATHMSPSCLALEITESDLVTNLKTAITILGKLRGMGIRIIVDDFGIGHSSLFCLNDLPIDVLKLDKSFLKDVMKAKKSRILLQGILELAHRLKLQVIAKGVETIEQFNLLQNSHCDSVQGSFISSPLNLEAFTNLLYLNDLQLSASAKFAQQEKLLVS